MVDELVLFSGNERTLRDLGAAALRRSLAVTVLTGDPAELVRVSGPTTAVRAPGGLVGAGVAAGAELALAGPTSAWFTALGPEVTGRTWFELTVDQARELAADAPAFVKLADAKVRTFPARRYRSVSELDEALAGLDAGPGLELLGTTGWLDVASEYRVFTRGHEVLTCSPYLVEDEPWSRELPAHRASFHREAAEFAAAVLDALDPLDVPPAAALDVARLSDGRYVVLEANQSWAAGPYGCDPDAVLDAVLAANIDPSAGADPRWRWTPPRDLVLDARPGRRGVSPD